MAEVLTPLNKADPATPSGKTVHVRNGNPAQSSTGSRRHRSRTDVALLGLVAGTLLAALVAAGFDLLPTVTGVPTPGMVINYGLPVSRAFTDLAAMAMFGFGLVPLLLPDCPPARRRAALRASTVANALLVLSAMLSLTLEAADVWFGQPLTFGLLVNYVGTEETGQALVATAALGLVCLAVNRFSMGRPDAVPTELRLVLAGVALLPLPLTGHGEDSLYHGLIMLTREAHVVSAAAWTGGLFALALLVSRHRRELAVALPRFSTLATVMLLVVGFTGIVDALVQLADTPGVGLAGLWSSRYGLIVLAKLACLIVLALLGGRIRFRLLPAVRDGRRVALLGWASLELTVMGLAYGLAAVLSHSPVVG
ncbi:MAG TPA: CopD family protein [Pseudonocardiaceae bacterium]|jgi:putative copper resistance protein D|nr:CopD family protein [Pseudonocardiaceae bacterium]